MALILSCDGKPIEALIEEPSGKGPPTSTQIMWHSSADPREPGHIPRDHPDDEGCSKAMLSRAAERGGVFSAPSPAASWVERPRTVPVKGAGGAGMAKPFVASHSTAWLAQLAEMPELGLAGLLFTTLPRATSPTSAAPSQDLQHEALQRIEVNYLGLV